MTAVRAPRRCPNCGSKSIVRIVYGLPGPELFEKAERGEVMLGGCIITGNDPAHGCLECGWPEASHDH